MPWRITVVFDNIESEESAKDIYFFLNSEEGSYSHLESHTTKPEEYAFVEEDADALL